MHFPYDILAIVYTERLFFLRFIERPQFNIHSQ